MGNYVPKDRGYKAAQQAGYRSRAALKLVEIDRKFRLLRTGMRVMDLGCWPGGWLQVASASVGPTGLVVGIDVEVVENPRLANVRTVVGDVSSEATIECAGLLSEGSVDVVLSDLAPKLSGVRDADRSRQLGLCEIALGYCDRFLKPGGACLIKVFSDSEQAATKLLGARFRKVTAYRPGATRKGSSEIYCVCSHYAGAGDGGPTRRLLG